MGKDIFRDFVVPFAGLKDGRNVFGFDVDDTFFKKFDNTNEISGAAIHVELVLDKKPGFLTLDFFVEGSIQAVCDRCANEFRQELLDEYRVYVKFLSHTQEVVEEDDVVYLPAGDTQINVANLVYEFIILTLPLKYVCPLKEDGTSGCNESVIKILEENKNEENNNKEDMTDPRWSALKKLK